MITDNQAYTYIATNLRNMGIGIHVTSERLYMVAEFPTVSIVCVDGTPVSGTIDFTETNRRSTFEVNVYTNSTMNEAKYISESIKKWFLNIGYRCRVFTPLDNVNDLTIKRYVGSYTRVIGDGDTLPENEEEE